jgi:hypothetical protein
MEDVGTFYDHMVYFTAIPLSIFYVHLVHFVAIWYILWPFGIFFQFWYVVLKSGNPADDKGPIDTCYVCT